MKEFPLGYGLVAKVDEEDWEMLIQYRWHPRRSRRVVTEDTWYATTNITLANGKRSKIDMHRLIMRPPAGMQVDHIDRDGLNNQRSNLRLCSNAENQRNSIKSPGRYPRGVFLVRGKKFGAQINIDGKKIYNGLNHETVEDAARAYNELAIRYHREFAVLNPLPEHFEAIAG